MASEGLNTHTNKQKTVTGGACVPLRGPQHSSCWGKSRRGHKKWLEHLSCEDTLRELVLRCLCLGQP